MARSKKISISVNENTLVQQYLSTLIAQAEELIIGDATKAKGLIIGDATKKDKEAAANKLQTIIPKTIDQIKKQGKHTTDDVLLIADAYRILAILLHATDDKLQPELFKLLNISRQSADKMYRSVWAENQQKAYNHFVNKVEHYLDAIRKGGDQSSLEGYLFLECTMRDINDLLTEKKTIPSISQIYG